MGSTPSRLDGSRVGYSDVGVGDPALVFVHGLVGNHTDFDHQVKAFSDAHRTVSIDLPGLATPAPERKVWTMAAFGEDVATVADHLGLRDMVLVGHSLGGDVIVEAALRLQGRVRGSVWVSSYRRLGGESSDAAATAWLEQFESDFESAIADVNRRNFGPRADPALVDEMISRGGRMDPAMVRGVLAAKLSNEPAVLAAIDRLGLPTVAINPDFKPNDHDSLRAHDIDLLIVPGVGHFTMLEDPDTFNDRLREALELIAGVGRA